MKCPNCGYESVRVNAGKRYRLAVEKRLVQYGYPEHMTPDKAQAVAAVRKTITVRFGLGSKSGGWMSPVREADALKALDIVLPVKM